MDDLDAALEWYATVFGFKTRIPPTELSMAIAGGDLMREMLGPAFDSLRYAVVSTGSGVFLEIFESHQPPTERSPQPSEFWRTGPWHIAVTSADVEGLVATIQEKGGRALSSVNAMIPGAPFKICMCVDPFDVTIEIYSHPIEEILAAMAD